MTDENDDGMRTVKLDVLNKEHQSLVTAGRSVDRDIVLGLALSLAALTFCFGWVAIDPRLSFGGMNISVTQTDLLLALAFAVTVLFWHSSVMAVYGQRLRRRIAALYDELGYHEHTDRLGFSGIIYPDVTVAMGALQHNVTAFLLEILRERPSKRGFRRKLASCCWVLTLLVLLALSIALLILPPIVDGFVVWYAWQRGAVGAGVVTATGVLLALYIAGIWMHLQTYDRQELGRSLSEVVEAFQDWLAYVQTQNSTPAASDTKAPEQDEFLRDASETGDQPGVTPTAPVL